MTRATVTIFGGLFFKTGGDRAEKTTHLPSRRSMIEMLEVRQFLSVSIAHDASLADIVVSPLSATALAGSTSANGLGAGADGYTPAEIRKAYGFDQLTLTDSSGKTVAADGAGQTIAIVVAYDAPTAQADLDVFSKAYGLPSTTITKLNQRAKTTNLPSADEGWAGEAGLDVQWAHAMAPGAKIVLVEADSASLKDLLAAVDVARHLDGVSVVSMSWGGSEFSGEAQYDSYFTTPTGHTPITFVAASGDEGSSTGALWPSVSTNVVAVGGTTLITSNDGSYLGEYGWSGSGGGVSRYVSTPSYQSAYSTATTSTYSSSYGTTYGGAFFSPYGGRYFPGRKATRTTVSATTRTTPDVSYNADPYTGFLVYNSYGADSKADAWQIVGGTSAGTPQWAAIFAIANQARTLAGAATLDTSGALSTLYTLAASASYASAFNDVTSGWNGFYSATSGYDKVTGLGSPEVDDVVRALVGNAVASTTAAKTTKITRSTIAQAARIKAGNLMVSPASEKFDGNIQLAPLAGRAAGVDTAATDAVRVADVMPQAEVVKAVVTPAALVVEALGLPSATPSAAGEVLSATVSGGPIGSTSQLWSFAAAEGALPEKGETKGERNIASVFSSSEVEMKREQPAMGAGALSLTSAMSFDAASIVTGESAPAYLLGAAVFCAILVKPDERKRAAAGAEQMPARRRNPLVSPM